MFELSNLDSIQIGLASPEKIREWSHGEVKKPETINYRTLKPERDGLFCERIFGPMKDWECHCGKYKRIRYKGIVCDKCGVEVTRAKVRRERMGHIELAAPVAHIWYARGMPSRMGLLLDMAPRDLEKVLYFAAYIVLDPGDTTLRFKEVLADKEYREAYDQYGERFRAGMGAEAIKELLDGLDCESLAEELRVERENTTGQRRIRAVRRLDIAESFRKSENKPSWMVMDVVPVIPPELRPMVQLDGGRFATSDLNDLYRRVINRNNRLKRLLELGAPDIIVRNEKRMLQEAVDALIDNGRRSRAVTGPGNRPLKSLSDLLRGKQGRFRQNLLGKRVDYSGRSVIVVGPELKLYQCGLPKSMALELFKPFVMKKLVAEGLAHNIKSAKRMVERVRPEVWDMLEDVIKEHPVLLNRAPTLHRLGIQAFEPVLVEGKALKIHPLVCTAFNADFDGDQMAVHVPLSVEAQAEARFLMLAANNILNPKDGKPVVSPTQDMIIGVYYLTIVRPGGIGEGRYFSNPDEAAMAYHEGQISLQSEVNIRFTKDVDGKRYEQIRKTTLGRVIFNQAIPQDLGYVDREDPENLFRLEIEKTVGKKELNQIVDACFRRHGPTRTAQVLDEIKSLGFKYATRGAATVSIADMAIPAIKPTLLKEAQGSVDKLQAMYMRGRLSEKDRYEGVIKIWEKVVADLTKAMMDDMDSFNPIYMMSNSGARGSTSQMRQLSAIRGLMVSPSGRTIERPILSSFREGLSVLDFFLSSHGSRKTLADTALKTAESGYLTRRLVEVGQEVVVREDDCFASRGERVRGMQMSDLMSGKEVVEPLEERIRGRYVAEDVFDPASGQLLAACDSFLDHIKAKAIVDAGVKTVSVRTILTCRNEHGVCAKCYGANLATGHVVDIGEAVGIVAAQSIGEPGTQLTMRTFHTGGVATGDDITQGLPRVAELFEARKPKGLAVVTEISGTVQISENKKKREVTVIAEDGTASAYPVSYGSRLKVSEGQYVQAGDELTDGTVNPHDILKIKGVKGVQEYLIKEVLSAYRMSGVEISNKHIEVVVRQMLRKVRIEEAGDTEMLPGSLVDIFRFEQANDDVIQNGGRPAVAKRTLLGISKATLATESFLSAASFQETTRVLTEAAVKGKVDPLVGLKENVLLGKLIPAGTGMKNYRNVDIMQKDQNI